MDKQKVIREGMKAILFEDLVNCGSTHENPPPHKDCEECGVSVESQIAASNPIMSPMRSGGKKHKRCMDCWNEYIDSLILRLLTKQASQDVVIKKRYCGMSHQGTWQKVFTVESLMEE